MNCELIRSGAVYDVWVIQDLQPEDDSSHDMTPDTVHRLLVLVLAVTLGPGREILLVAGDSQWLVALLPGARRTG